MIENKQNTRSASADQAQLRILSPTITSQEITNWPCFPLPSSCSIPAPPDLCCLHNHLHLREIRTCVSYHSSSYPQHTMRLSVPQSLANLWGKSCPELNCTKGKRWRKQVLLLQDGGPPPASLGATLMVTAAMLPAMDPLLTLHRTHRHYLQQSGKHTALMSPGLSCTKRGRSSLQLILTAPFQVTHVGNQGERWGTFRSSLSESLMKIWKTMNAAREEHLKDQVRKHTALPITVISYYNEIHCSWLGFALDSGAAKGQTMSPRLAFALAGWFPWHFPGIFNV